MHEAPSPPPTTHPSSCCSTSSATHSTATMGPPQHSIPHRKGTRHTLCHMPPPPPHTHTHSPQLLHIQALQNLQRHHGVAPPAPQHAAPALWSSQGRGEGAALQQHQLRWLLLQWLQLPLQKYTKGVCGLRCALSPLQEHELQRCSCGCCGCCGWCACHCTHTLTTRSSRTQPPLFKSSALCIEEYAPHQPHLRRLAALERVRMLKVHLHRVTLLHAPRLLLKAWEGRVVDGMQVAWVWLVGVG